jgi:hypothetical protein
VDRGQLDAAEDVLAAGPGQEGEGVLPRVWPGGEPAIELVLDAFAELVSAVGHPGQEGGRCGEALHGPLVGAVADRRRGCAAGSQVPQQVPPEKPFEQLEVLGVAEGVELGCGPALEVSQAPIAGRQHTITNQQAPQVFDSAVRPEDIQGGMTARDAAMGQALQGLASYRAPPQPHQPALRAAHRHQPPLQGPVRDLRLYGHAGQRDAVLEVGPQDQPPAMCFRAASLAERDQHRLAGRT